MLINKYKEELKLLNDKHKQEIKDLKDQIIPADVIYQFTYSFV